MEVCACSDYDLDQEIHLCYKLYNTNQLFKIVEFLYFHYFGIMDLSMRWSSNSVIGFLTTCFSFNKFMTIYGKIKYEHFKGTFHGLKRFLLFLKSNRKEDIMGIYIYSLFNIFLFIYITCFYYFWQCIRNCILRWVLPWLINTFDKLIHRFILFA